MTKNVPALIARTHFGQILERASQNNERFVITKKGEAKAIILGVEDFLQAVENPPESLVELHKQAKRSGTYEMTLEETEKEIESVRGVKQKHPAKRGIHKQKT
jgi:prevent-host-death family protein